VDGYKKLTHDRKIDIVIEIIPSHEPSRQLHRRGSMNFRYIDLILKYPTVMLAIHRLFDPLYIPIRLMNWGKYRDLYTNSIDSFRVGDAVRLKERKDEERCRVMLAPAVQEIMGVPTSRQSSNEAVEMVVPEHVPDILTNSFFNLRETWIVVSVDDIKFEDWMYGKIVCGYGNETPGGLVIKPLDETKIAWPETTRYGKNMFWTPRELLEKVS
jgi:hypothetical protein